jgi:hypothetical protein
LAAEALFRFVQFEFPFQLGPDDGRYLRRSGGEPRQVIVLRTIGAPPRRLLRGRRASPVNDAQAAPVPTVRATLIEAEPDSGEGEAERWLAELRRDRSLQQAAVESAAAELAALLRAHRAAAADPYTRELSPSAATVVRVGYGSGDMVAEGRFHEALEIPERHRRRRRVEALAPQERLAAILAGRDQVLACEELVLRARTDLIAQRPREAALQARIALEAVLAELPESSEELEPDRAAVADAANAALAGDPPAELSRAVTESVEHMERAVRRHAHARPSP